MKGPLDNKSATRRERCNEQRTTLGTIRSKATVTSRHTEALHQRNKTQRH